MFNQALRVTKTLKLEQKKTKEILDIAASFVPKFTFDKTPPQNAAPMYEAIANYLKVDDLYKEIKRDSIQKAKMLEPKAKQFIEEAEDQFVTATKVAVVGNVIDLASEVIFDLESEVENVINSSFAIDHTKELERALESAKEVAYLADNAGENIFDALYIEYLLKRFPKLKIYYFVRTKPIINDLTIDDLKGDRLNSLTTIVDSGIETPGIIYEDLKPEAKEIFDRADIIISKGMGNYECLSDMVNFPLYFLLKIKCNVVASSLKSNIGDIICKKI